MVVAVVDYLEVACPVCGAPWGEPCPGRSAGEPHFDRVLALGEGYCAP